MRLSGKHWWPFFASVSAHAAIAAMLIVSPGRASKPEQRLESRDIWIGETLDAADPAGNAQEPGERTPPEGPQQTETAKPAPAVPPARLRVQRAHELDPNPAVDPAAALAARILAYTPNSGTARSKHADVADPPASGTQGGMKSEEQVRARGFAKAFARALPAANTSDPVWGELPVGSLGVVRVSVVLDDDGAIAESRVWDRPKKPPSYLARLVDRTLVMLRGGHFALAKTGRGKETLKLDVTLSERPMESGPLALGFDAPSPGTPGRAYFQIASGRLVDARVTIEPN